MSEYKKPPVVKGLLWKRVRIGMLVLLIGLALMSISLYNGLEYKTAKENAVTVTATISEVNIDEDPDYGTEYEVYVQYTYNGGLYSKLHLVSSKEEWLDRVGDEIRITINGRKPDVELEDLVDPIFFGMFFGLPIFCVGLAVLLIQNYRLSHVEMYGQNSGTIRADLMGSSRVMRLWIPIMVYGLGNILFGIYMLSMDSVGAGIILFGAVALPFAIAAAVRAWKAQKKIHTAEYVTFSSVVMDKRVTDIDEGTKRYELCVERYNRKMWFTFSQEDYNLTEVGDSLTFVLAEGFRLCYRHDQRDGSCWMMNR